MGSEQPASYYDEHIANFLVPYEGSIWKEVYDATVSLFPDATSATIVDVGCGTGRLAEALRRSGRINYIGFDFSSARIAEARRYLPEHDFRVLDAFSDEARALMNAADVVSITEVLEHVEGDLDLLSSLPTGKTVVFSVPSFDSPTHVRKFKTMDAVLERYSGILDIDADSAVTVTRRKNHTFVARGSRR